MGGKWQLDLSDLCLVEVLDASPQGVEFWGFCITPQALGPSPFCPSEGPIPVFEPAGLSLTLPRQHLDSISGFR